MLNTQCESVNSEFESERIVILGGTSGIGLATAERVAAAGATVIVASSSADRIDAALVGRVGEVNDIAETFLST